MAMTVVTHSAAILIVVFFIHGSLRADPIRLSLLNDAGALQNTVDFLTRSGCKSNAVGSFRKAVERFYSTLFRFDLSKFPPAQHGFYSFQSSSELLPLIPHRLWDIQHTFDFTCFDTAILLADEQLRTSLTPDSQVGEYLPQGTGENGEVFYGHAKTAREAFAFSCPAYYLKTSDGYFPLTMTDTRICLTAAFYTFHRLSASTPYKSLDKHVLDVLQASWKNQGITFPSKFQIVLCHQVNLTQPFVVTTHAGLLFPVEKGYIYIEKSGGSGPFVRLDLGNRADLSAFLAWTHEKTMEVNFFVTFNDSKIEMLH